MDNDGDIDIIFSEVNNSFPNRGIFWQENLDGQANFGLPQKLNQSTNFSVELMEIEDLDLDGDLDIVAVDNGFLYWFDNLGNGNFTSELVVVQNLLDHLNSLAKKFLG